MAVEIRTRELILRRIFEALKEREEHWENHRRYMELLAENEDLRREHDRLFEEIGCHICMNFLQMVEFNCGHSVCAMCDRKLETCPFCRAKITQRFEIKRE